MSVKTQLEAMHIKLTPPEPPVGAFVPFAISGNLVFISGHIAKRDGQPWTGRLGENLRTADGQAAARAVAIDVLGTLEAAVGDLNRIKRITKLLVLVNSAPTFTEQHLVANGASELFKQVFGEGGPHARSAVGVAALPFGACVEIELIAEI